MKELWIHAGMPKNGSSAIQVFLAKHIDELRKEGLDYLELSDITDAKQGQISSGNGALLARSMLSETHESFYKKENTFYNDLLFRINNSQCDKMLISTEFFALVPLEKIKKLKEDLLERGTVLKFIYYVRRQDQFLMSTYMQRVKRHAYTGYPDDFIIDIYKNVNFLNYYGYAKQYSEVLGDDNLYPFIYESTRSHEKGLIGQFVKTVIGYLPNWVDSQKVVNSSPSALELKLLLCMNQYSPRMKLSDFVIEDSIARGRSYEYKNHTIISSELIKEVLDYFKIQNNQFLEEYCHNEKFPDATESEFIDLKLLSFTPNEMMGIIAGFLVRYDRRLFNLESEISVHETKS